MTRGGVQEQARRAAAAAGATLAALVGLVPGARAAAPARYLPPDGAPYHAEEVRVRTSGLFSLGGTFTTPLDGHRHPAIVLISGAGKQDRDSAIEGVDYRPFYDIADTLSRRGIAVLRLDDRGVGSSTGTLDPPMSVVEDTQAALEFLRARPDVDRGRLGLLGFHEGSWVAQTIAAGDPELAAIVLMAPPGSGADLAREQRLGSPRAAPADPSYTALIEAWERGVASDRWKSDSFPAGPNEIARGVRCPVLILEGSQAGGSAPVAPADSLTAPVRAGGNREVSVQSFEGLDALFLNAADFTEPGASSPFTPKLPPRVLGTLADWLGSRLDPGSEPRLTQPRPFPHRRSHGARPHRRRRHSP